VCRSIDDGESGDGDGLFDNTTWFHCFLDSLLVDLGEFGLSRLVAHLSGLGE
jgi:hypothetical protein